MEIRDRKAAQRRAGIMARRGLPQAERAAANAAICARILAMPCFQKAENLLIYAAFGGEVDLAGLAEQAARLGKTVAYPVCEENFTLTAAVPGLDGWEVGAYGIRTPVLERAALVRPEALDLVLVPCTAFDAACRRVGMGKGYYDRYLEDYDGVTIGLCREDFFQVNLPREPLDAWVRFVLTEEGQVWPMGTSAE